MSFKSGLTGFSVVVNFFLSIGEGGEVFVGRVGREERQVLKRVCLVWRERVRLEVGVVVGLEGTFGRGRTCGSSVSAAVTDDSGRGPEISDECSFKNYFGKESMFVSSGSRG